MTTHDNSTLFTDISAKESSTVNGGSLISKPRRKWGIVRDGKTGKLKIVFRPFRPEGSFFSKPLFLFGSNFSILR